MDDLQISYKFRKRRKKCRKKSEPVAGATPHRSQPNTVRVRGVTLVESEKKCGKCTSLARGSISAVLTGSVSRPTI